MKTAARRTYRRLVLRNTASFRAGLASTSGVVDLASVIVGVVVVAALAGILSASIVSAIPWGKDTSAKAALATVQSGETAARIATGSYLTGDQLIAGGYLAKASAAGVPGEEIRGGRGASVAPSAFRDAVTLPAAGSPQATVGNNGSCYVAAVLSASGNIYYMSSQDTTIRTTKADQSAPDTTSCALFPHVAPFPGPQIQLTYPNQVFDTTLVHPKITPKITGGNMSAPAFTCTIAGAPCGVANMPLGVTFDSTNGVFVGLDKWNIQVRSIQNYGNSSCALTNKGGVKCWGSDGSGALGDGGSSGVSLVPQDVPGLTSGVAKLSGGGMAKFPCVVLVSGGVRCWGSGLPGDGRTSGYANTPAQPQTTPTGLDSGVVDIATSVDAVCALMKDTTTRCWGYQNYGEGNIGSTGAGYYYSPVTSGIPTGGVSITAGRMHFCVATATGAAFCWGSALSNNYVLGNGAAATKSSATQVSNLRGTAYGDPVVVKVIAGMDYSCALTADGAVWCWGLATSTIFSPNPPTGGTPNKLPGMPEPMIDMAGSTDHVCTIGQSGALYCWGDNANGAVGNGSLTPSTVGTPYKVTALGANVRVTAMGLADSSTCAVADGSLKCWGNNSANGLLGNNSTADSYAPVQVVGLAATPGFPINASVAADDGTTSASTTVRITPW